MIDVRNLTKHYGPTRSVEDVSFRVEQGEILGFLGPNGAGKSTTMKIMAGLIRPTRGEALVDGFHVQRDHEKVRRKIGYLPESAPVYPDMTLADFLEFMGGIKGLDRRAAKREMERTTSLVNLQKERPRLLRNLSKGTRQRAAIAQALLGDPPVLLLDEPTVGLDPSQINDVRNLIRSLAGKRTVILSTHILQEVELSCTRIVIIAGGNVVAQGTPQELVAMEAAEYFVSVRGNRAALQHAIDQTPRLRMAELLEVDGHLNARLLPEPGREDARPELARNLVKGELQVLEIRMAQVRLEDIFMKAIGKAGSANK